MHRGWAGPGDSEHRDLESVILQKLWAGDWGDPGRPSHSKSPTGIPPGRQVPTGRHSSPILLAPELPHVGCGACNKSLRAQVCVCTPRRPATFDWAELTRYCGYSYYGYRCWCWWAHADDAPINNSLSFKEETTGSRETPGGGRSSLLGASSSCTGHGCLTAALQASNGTC